MPQEAATAAPARRVFKAGLGPGEDIVSPLLVVAGAQKIDIVVLSHPTRTISEAFLRSSETSRSARSGTPTNSATSGLLGFVGEGTAKGRD